MSAIPEPSRRRLALTTAVALVAATVIFVVVVLPAEFGIDPTGFGRVSGLSGLSGTPARTGTVEGASGAGDATGAEVTPGAGAGAAIAGGSTSAHAYPSAYRTDTFDIPLGFADELEFKVAMKSGGTFVYSWTAEGAAGAESLHADFHSEVPDSEPEKVAEHRQANELAANGSLVAPFDGVHGWYFRNDGDTDVVVHLEISGFYEPIPAGQYGNERGIRPRT